MTTSRTGDASTTDWSADSYATRLRQVITQTLDSGRSTAAEVRYGVLGLLFLKYLSDVFEEQHAKLEASGADPNVPSPYQARSICWLPPEARWARLETETTAAMGVALDAAMAAIERDNPALRNVLPRDYARMGDDGQVLRALIEAIGEMELGDEASRSIGRGGWLYEEALALLARAEARSGGISFTPPSVAALLVEMMEPDGGRVYDPCCGTAGTLTKAVEFARARSSESNREAADSDEIAVFGQESNGAMWRVAKMNLAIRGIEGKIALGDALRNDHYPELRAEFVLASPPFNAGWESGAPNDVRWQFGVPPPGNANFAWVQHAVRHLAPAGMAGLVLANVSTSSTHPAEERIRSNLIEASLVDCIVALPGQLYESTAIPASLWLLASERPHREILFIDGRRLGRMVDRRRRELTSAEIARIATTYRTWRRNAAGERMEIAGFCRSATPEEVRAQGWTLTPGRYVGVEEPQEVDVEENATRLVAALHALMEEDRGLDEDFRACLASLGFPMGGGS